MCLQSEDVVSVLQESMEISQAPFVVRLKQDAESLMHPFHNIAMWQGQDVAHSLRLKIRKWHCLMQRHSCNWNKTLTLRRCQDVLMELLSVGLFLCL